MTFVKKWVSTGRDSISEVSFPVFCVRACGQAGLASGVKMPSPRFSNKTVPRSKRTGEAKLCDLSLPGSRLSRPGPDNSNICHQCMQCETYVNASRIRSVQKNDVVIIIRKMSQAEVSFSLKVTFSKESRLQLSLDEWINENKLINNFETLGLWSIDTLLSHIADIACRYFIEKNWSCKDEYTFLRTFSKILFQVPVKEKMNNLGASSRGGSIVTSLIRGESVKRSRRATTTSKYERTAE